MIVIIKIIEIYNIAAQPYIIAGEPIITTSKQSHHAYVLKRRFVTSYAQPVIQQYKSRIKCPSVPQNA